MRPRRAAGSPPADAVLVLQLRRSVEANPLDIRVAMAYADILRQVQLYEPAQKAYEYAADLAVYLDPQEPLSPEIALPWSLCAFQTEWTRGKCLTLADQIRTAGEFDLSLEAVAGLAAIQMGDADKGNQRLRQAAQIASGLLKQTPGATVVNLCSASSIHGIPKLAVYSASKFYVNGLTEALDLEWREHGIRVTSVKPPVINNPMGLAVADELPQKLGISLSSEDVAEHIQRAAEGRGTSFPMGAATRSWYWIDKLLPNALRSRLTKFLAGHE